MKVLNLWSNGAHRRKSIKNQFGTQVLFALLLSVLILGAVSIWLDWRVKQALAVNTLLQSELSKIQADVPKGGDEAAQQRAVQWRIQRTSQLDWLVALADSAGSDVLFTSVKQTATGLELTGNASSTEAARLALSGFAQQSPNYGDFKITRLSASSNSHSSKPWLFEAQFTFNPSPIHSVVELKTVPSEMNKEIKEKP